MKMIAAASTESCQPREQSHMKWDVTIYRTVVTRGLNDLTFLLYVYKTCVA